MNVANRVSTVQAVAQGLDRAVRGHGVVGSVTLAFVAYAGMMACGMWVGADQRDGGTTQAGMMYGSLVFGAYLLGVLVFSWLSPESAAMEGSQLLTLRLATKETGPILAENPMSPD